MTEAGDEPQEPQFFDPHAETEKREGANLPHWTQEGRCYFITFRLADSLPQVKLEQWRDERKRLEQQAAARIIGEAVYRQRAREITREIEHCLDRGYGDCLMNSPQAAEIVQSSLLHFDEQRYTLWAWSVMPNHVHAVLSPKEGHQLQKILQSWKSFSAKAMNRLLGRTGSCWESEYFDHLIRSQASFEWCVEYTYSNPDRAGLKDWRWRGRHGGMGILPMQRDRDDV